MSVSSSSSLFLGVCLFLLGCPPCMLLRLLEGVITLCRLRGPGSGGALVGLAGLPWWERRRLFLYPERTLHDLPFACGLWDWQLHLLRSCCFAPGAWESRQSTRDGAGFPPGPTGLRRPASPEAFDSKILILRLLGWPLQLEREEALHSTSPAGSTLCAPSHFFSVL